MKQTIKEQLDAMEFPREVMQIVVSGNVIVSGDIVVDYLTMKYGIFYCDSLYGCWTTYNALQATDFARALQAYNTVYNPLENENVKEKRVHLENNGKEIQTRETDPNHNTTTVEAINGTKTDTLSTTFESATPRLDNRVETSGGTTTTDDLKISTEKEYNNTSLTLDDTTYSAHNVNAEIFEKSGDSGVTPQTMIKDENALRLNPVTKQYIDRFVFEYCYYVGGAWSY